MNISQILDFERRVLGKKPLVPQVSGWIQATKRQLPHCQCGSLLSWDQSAQAYACACGSARAIEEARVTQQLAQHNIITKDFFIRAWDAPGTAMHTSARVFISNWDTPVHEWHSIYANSFQDAHELTLTASVNSTLNYWQFSGTFSAPTAPGRTIAWVGMGPTAMTLLYTYSRIFYALAGTRLTSPVFQSNTETFEIVYRLQFTQL